MPGTFGELLPWAFFLTHCTAKQAVTSPPNLMMTYKFRFIDCLWGYMPCSFGHIGHQPENACNLVQQVKTLNTG